MSFIFRLFLVAAILCIFPHTLEAVTLVENGAPKATVVIAPNAPAVDQKAAHELIRCIEKATGAKLPLASKPSSGAVILVGAAACPPEIAARVERLSYDGIFILADGNRLVLAGKGSQGTIFAVCAFLEKYMGVRWLWPGELGEVVPKTRTLRLDKIETAEEPAFPLRSIVYLSRPPEEPYVMNAFEWGPWELYEHRVGAIFDPEVVRQCREWSERNRLGGPEMHGGHIWGGHAWGFMVPPEKYGKTNPEYYALLKGDQLRRNLRYLSPEEQTNIEELAVKGRRMWEDWEGKHGAQLCTTNPDVIRLSAEWCIQAFDENPDWQLVCISPNDGRGFCECDKCLALDTVQRTAVASGTEGAGGVQGVITDRIFTFANQVTEMVTQKYPDKYLVMIAYGSYQMPPSPAIKIHPNLIVQCHLRASRYWNPEWKKQDFEVMDGWSDAAEKLGVYAFTTQGSLADMPRLIPELMQESFRRLHEKNFRYYQTQGGVGFAINGLNYYLASKLLWDPQQDQRQIVLDYMEKGFGPAAPAMTRYFDGFINRFKENGGQGLGLDFCNLKTYQALVDLYPPEFRKARRKDLEEALRLASGDERKRVEFVIQGMEHVDLTLNAVEKSILLMEAGWELGPRVKSPAWPDWKAFDDALYAWIARDEYVSSHKQTCVIAYRWIRYNDNQRGFMPLYRMQEWVRKNPPIAGPMPGEPDARLVPVP